MRYVAKRLAVSLLTAWLATIAVFLLLSAIPGNVVQQMLGQAGDSSANRALTNLFGLNRPLYAQYWVWLDNLLHGNLGKSWSSSQPVSSAVYHAFLVTFELSCITLILATVVGIPLGLIAATKEGGKLDSLIQGITVLGLSTPIFWLGAMLLVGVYKATGWAPPLIYEGPTESLGDNLRILALPVLSLSFLQAAAYAQFVRQSALSAFHEQYVQTAIAKGLPASRVLLKHILRNIAVNLTTFVSLVFIQILGGAVVIESLFALPGLGRLLLTSIENRDTPVVQGGLLLVVIVALIVNLVVDLVYNAIDPRLRT